MPLGHSGGDGSHAHLGHQLHVDPRLGIDVLQVVDQLCQVFDRVDVMVRRRRDQLNARRRVPHPANVFIHLVPGQLAALARLGTLGHFDLKIGGVHQVVGRNAKPTGSHLLDGAGTIIAIFVRRVAVEVLSTFAGVAARAQLVHGDRHGFVRFPTDGTQRNGAGGKPLHNVNRGFHLIQVDGLKVLEFEQAPQSSHAPALVVDLLGELAIGPQIVGAGGILQLGNGFGIPLVMLAVSPPLVLAAHVQFLHPRNERVVEGRPVPLQSFLFHGVQPDSLDAGGCAGEIAIDQVIVQADGFEDLGSPVRLHRGDAHLGHYLEDAFFIGLDEVVDRVLRLGTVQLAAFGQITNGFQGQVGIDAASAVTDQQAAMLNFSRLSRFYDQANPGPRAGAGQMMVNRAGGQQAGNGSVVGVHAAVGQDDEVLALGNGLRRSVAQVVQSPLHRSRFRLEQRGQRGRRHSRQVQGLDLRQLLVGEQRRLEPQLPAVLRTFVEQVLLAADKRFQRSDQLLPDRVQRRVGHLGK